MCILKSAILALAAACVLAAQDPDPKGLLLESGKALFTLGNFRAEQEMTMETEGNGISQKTAITMKLSSGGGKFRMETAPLAVKVVADGQFTWFFVAPLNQYMKRPAASTPEGLVESMMPGMGAMVSKTMNALKSVKMLAGEMLEVQGRKVDCYVIETEMGGLDLPAPPGARMLSSHQTAWIDKQRKLMLKQVSDMEMQLNATAEPVKIHQQTLMTALDFAPVFAADEFTFNPPAGATLVESLPGMPGK